MLPALLLSGIGSMVTAAAAGLVIPDPAHASFGGWLEIWLVGWGVAFPVAYLAGRPLVRLALRRRQASAAPSYRLGAEP